mmetsp:Transcript_4811/g.11161  ORF Transcript_4811/g.11161 Transcript_4811/m.11161 type:complete len:205 (-) Transcript_4811:93-707(-)
MNRNDLDDFWFGGLLGVFGELLGVSQTLVCEWLGFVAVGHHKAHGCLGEVEAVYHTLVVLRRHRRSTVHGAQPEAFSGELRAGILQHRMNHRRGRVGISAVNEPGLARKEHIFEFVAVVKRYVVESAIDCIPNRVDDLEQTTRQQAQHSQTDDEIPGLPPLLVLLFLGAFAPLVFLWSTSVAAGSACRCRRPGHDGHSMTLDDR